MPHNCTVPPHLLALVLQPLLRFPLQWLPHSAHFPGKESQAVWSFVTGFFHPTSSFQGLAMFSVYQCFGFSVAENVTLSGVIASSHSHASIPQNNCAPPAGTPWKVR